MKLPTNCIYKGTLMHHRLVPREHKFTYNIFYTFINVDDLDHLKKKYTFFSYNHFNIFSIYDSDHGFRNKKTIKFWLKNILKKIGIKQMNTKIFLLTMPRIFGYAFNPLSIFFCYDLKGNIKAIIYEVKNTFNEQHCYVFKIKDSFSKKIIFKHTCQKKFHVSPFLDMKAKYNFTISKPGKNFNSSINMQKKETNIFLAMLKCKYQKINLKNLIFLLIKYPFLTIKVVLAIYYEAIKLFIFKKAKYVKKPILKNEITTIKK